MSVAALAVKRPIATTMLLIASVLLGVVSLLRMELTLLPETRDEEITVWIPDPDAAVPEIEQAVARPAEDALITVRGVAGVRTQIVPGGLSMRLRLHPGTDTELATLGVREKLDALRWQLPESVGRPVVLGGSSHDRPAFVLALAASDLESAADWAESVLRPRLEQAEGVARAEVQGIPRREIRVVPDEARLQATGIGVEQLAAAVRAANAPSPGGSLRRRGVRYALHVDSEIATAKQVGDVVVGGDAARPVHVRDVARVEDGIAPPDGWSRLDGAPAVGILVYQEAGANLLHTADKLHERLDELQREFPDFHVAIVSDPAPFVRQSISNLWQAVWFGGLLAFGVLLYFLNDIRSPAILMTTLPVATLASFAILDVLGVSLNIMSLGGIALSVGTLVDNSIICLDNMYRLRSRGMAPARAAAEGAREVSLPMLASTFTTLSVFVPLALVPGRFGALFRDQAASVAVSQLVSLFVSLTLLPMLAARVAPPRRSVERMPLYGAYHRLLVACLRRPAVFIGVLLALLGASVVYLAHVPREILPEVASEDVELHLQLPPGSDVTATDAATQDIEAWLRARPEVVRIHSTVGAAGTLDPSETGRQLHRATLRVRLDKHHVKERAALLEALAAHVAPHTDWSLDAAPSRPELANLFLHDEATLTCEISGQDDAIAQETAAELVREAQPHLADTAHPLRLVQTELEPRYTLTLDTEAVWRHGLRTEDVLRAVQARTSGYEALRVRRFDTEDPVVVRAAGATPPAAASIVVDGRTFPIRELFTVRTELAPAGLLRVNQARVATIRWDGPLQDVARVQSALDRAAATVSLPAGYTLHYGGAYEEMRATLAGLLRVFALSAGLVFLILAAQFESVRLPLIIFTDIPLALIGVALALLVSGKSLNALSAVGVVILNGVVVNDSILKVDLLRRFQAEGVGRLRALLLTSRRHYRPIWMTTLTTILGLVPIFFGTGAELLSSLATTVIGGLFVSTILTLLVVPVIFHWIAGQPKPRLAPATTAPLATSVAWEAS
jgi:HAE1 family hydrophobic/amphiphilic exporter-1